MSTKSSAAFVNVETIIGDETFHANLHCYEECFDEPPHATMYVEIWEQGVHNNHRTALAVPADKFRAFAHELGRWAQRQDEWDQEQAEAAKETP